MHNYNHVYSVYMYIHKCGHSLMLYDPNYMYIPQMTVHVAYNIAFILSTTIIQCTKAYIHV